MQLVYRIYNRKKKDKPNESEEKQLHETGLETEKSIVSIEKKKTVVTQVKKNKVTNKWKSKRLAIIGSIIFLFVPLLITLYLIFISANGLYYPIISSIDKNTVQQEVKKMNDYIDERGYDDLHLSVFCNPVQDACAVVPGGVHFSKEKANETLERAKKLIPQYTDVDGAWVASYTFDDTFIRKIEQLWNRVMKTE